MVRVIRFRNVSVFILDERGGRHHEPHCHVKWSGKICSIRLRDLEVLAGDPLPRDLRELLDGHKDELWSMWRMMNGE